MVSYLVERYPFFQQFCDILSSSYDDDSLDYIFRQYSLFDEDDNFYSL